MNSYRLNTDGNAGKTKIQQIVHAIVQDVNNGRLKAGDPLPSVNRLSNESGFSRDTVFKAYRILKSRNIIQSAPAKGYFVAAESFKIFMLLDDFSAFKEQLYYSFRTNLPKGYSVDLLFHHYNRDVFRQLIENSLNRYHVWIVMNIEHRNVDPVLNKIDFNKLLILDMGKPDDNRINIITQDFNQSVTNCLEQGLERFRKYNEFILVYEEKITPHPSEVRQAVKLFCESKNISCRIIPKFDKDKLKAGQSYFVIRDTDLVEVIKACREVDLNVGEDVGVVSYNDTPMKQIIERGVTVVSTDFDVMGKLAAEFVRTKKPVREILPARLIIRSSL